MEETLHVPETAAFRGDDPTCLVTAGLACRLCLSSEVEFELAGEPWEHEARCRCRECGHRRSVSLTPEQALRLALHDGASQPDAPVPLAGLSAIV